MTDEGFFFLQKGMHVSQELWGSTLGPTILKLQISLLGAVIGRLSINFQSYADDTQLYMAMPPEDSWYSFSLFFFRYQVLDCRPADQPGGKEFYLLFPNSRESFFFYQNGETITTCWERCCCFWLWAWFYCSYQKYKKEKFLLCQRLPVFNSQANTKANACSYLQ